MLLACKGGTFHVLRCAYITDTRSLGAEGAPAAENYNLNGRRPFPHARLSPCFHLNISFLCAIQIPRPFFSNRALGHAIPRVVVTLRNFLLPRAAPPFPRRCIREWRTRSRTRRVLFQWRNWKKVVLFVKLPLSPPPPPRPSFLPFFLC